MDAEAIAAGRDRWQRRYDATGAAARRTRSGIEVRPVYGPPQGVDDPRFEIEETVLLGDRAAVRWRYSWREESDERGHVRGVDVLRLRDGKIADIEIAPGRRGTRSVAALARGPCAAPPTCVDAGDRASVVGAALA